MNARPPHSYWTPHERDALLQRVVGQESLIPWKRRRRKWLRDVASGRYYWYKIAAVLEVKEIRLDCQASDKHVELRGMR